jgi:dihydrofolate synthase/folylpolyglutamate synthase
MTLTFRAWLDYLATIHPTTIDLSLSRVSQVAERLELLHPTQPVITVGGTNGKGSTVSGLHAIYRAAGFKVGSFTSPFLMTPHEWVRVNERLATDDEFCKAYQLIETARDEISLTIFEFNTLAALLIFKQQPLDVLILEIGLGGRFDAVNIIDADVAIVTSIGLDHTDRLGDTRESIAFQKSGIFRSYKPAVYGDLDPPQSLLDDAKQRDVILYRQGKTFTYHAHSHHWSWQYGDLIYEKLPLNALYLQNMSTVLMAVTLLQSRLPVSCFAIECGLKQAALPGRIEIITGPVMRIDDVSHNPAAVSLLSERLQHLSIQGKTRAVFSMLADKDIVSSIRAIQYQIDHWYVAPIADPRGLDLKTLQAVFKEIGIQAVTFSDSIESASRLAADEADEADRIVTFGSFHTVAEARKAREQISV